MNEKRVKAIQAIRKKISQLNDFVPVDASDNEWRLAFHIQELLNELLDLVS